MAAIVSGASLGINQSSLALLGAQGQLGAAVHGRAGERVYVNSATGNLVIQNQDEILIGRGPDALVLRTYNSQGLLDDDNADNWRIGAYRKVHGLTSCHKPRCAPASQPQPRTIVPSAATQQGKLAFSRERNAARARRNFLSLPC